MTRSTLPAAAAALLLSLPAAAQTPGADQPVRAVRQSTGFVLEAGAHDLGDLIDSAALYLGRNILVNPMEFQAGSGSLEIRLHKRIEVDAPGCWELLNTFLYHKGFAIVPLDPERGFYEVVSMAGPRRAEVSSSAEFVPQEKVAEYAQQKATPILTTYPLVHVNATIATNSLRPFFMSGGAPQGGGLTLGNVGSEHAILLQGFGPQVHAACQLLRIVDVPTQDAATRLVVVRLEHAAAGEVVASIQRALMTNSGMSPQGMPMQPTLSLVPHASLNAVLLRGTESEIQRVQDLIAALDVPSAAPEPPSVDLMEKIEALERRIAELEKAAGKHP